MSSYGGFALAMAQGYLNGKTLKAMLVTTAYTQDPDVSTVSSLPAGTEIPASGSYTAGGVVLTNVTIAYDASMNMVKIDCDDIVFPAVAGPVDAAGVLYYEAASGTMIAYDAFAATQTLSNTILTHQIAADGFVTVQV